MSLPAVAAGLGAQLVDGAQDRRDLVLVLGVRPGRVDDRPVPNVDRVGAARHLDHRRPAEMRGEPLGVDGRGGDDHLQVRSAGEQGGDVAEQEVDVQAALVRLVDDEGVVARQVAVPLDLGEQHAVGHQPDHRGVADPVGEADRVADRTPERDVQLLRDAFGDRPRGDPPGLGVPDQPVHAATQLEADLRQLGRLAGPGLARDDDDLVVTDRLGDLVLALRDREVGWVGDDRSARPSRLGAPGRLLGRA